VEGDKGIFLLLIIVLEIREVTPDRIEFSSFLILFYQYIHNR